MPSNSIPPTARPFSPSPPRENRHSASRPPSLLFGAPPVVTVATSSSINLSALPTTPSVYQSRLGRSPSHDHNISDPGFFSYIDQPHRRHDSEPNLRLGNRKGTGTAHGDDSESSTSSSSPPLGATSLLSALASPTPPLSLAKEQSSVVAGKVDTSGSHSRVSSEPFHPHVVTAVQPGSPTSVHSILSSTSSGTSGFPSSRSLPRLHQPTIVKRPSGRGLAYLPPAHQISPSNSSFAFHHSHSTHSSPAAVAFVTNSQSTPTRHALSPISRLGDGNADVAVDEETLPEEGDPVESPESPHFRKAVSAPRSVSSASSSGSACQAQPNLSEVLADTHPAFERSGPDPLYRRQTIILPATTENKSMLKSPEQAEPDLLPDSIWTDGDTTFTKVVEDNSLDATLNEVADGHRVEEVSTTTENDRNSHHPTARQEDVQPDAQPLVTSSEVDSAPPAEAFSHTLTPVLSEGSSNTDGKPAVEINASHLDETSIDRPSTANQPIPETAWTAPFAANTDGRDVIPYQPRRKTDSITFHPQAHIAVPSALTFYAGLGHPSQALPQLSRYRLEVSLAWNDPTFLRWLPGRSYIPDWNLKLVGGRPEEPIVFDVRETTRAVISRIPIVWRFASWL
nr:uncharacterized protein CI109_007238 [Kwoniella shandongensis]KAA5524446.1 hypothetical protein CI109_007238 [Kwoniella shandongensis]